MGGVFTENQPEYEDDSQEKTNKTDEVSKVDALKTQIATKPETLDKTSKKDLEDLKPYLLANKDKATELLFTTLEGLKADTKGVRRGDRKTLENIQAMIIDNKYSSVEKVGEMQLKADIFNDAFDIKALEKYGILFDQEEKGNANWFKNIGATYKEGAYKAFDIYFKKEFADKYFTPTQFQKELYTKNEARMTKLVTALTKFCIGDFMTENKITEVSALETGSCNLWKDKNIDPQYTANKSSSEYYEYEYLIKNNPTILEEWKLQISNETKMMTDWETQETNTLVTSFTKESVLANYLAKNKKDDIYNFNNNASYSKLGDIVTSLTDAAKTYPTNKTLTGLITSLKDGKFEDVQTTIYEGYTSKLKKTIDGKFGTDTKNALDAYLLKLKPTTKETTVDKKIATPIDNTSSVIKTETISETVDVPTFKKNLLAFDITKAKTILASGVLMSDYKKLFTAAATGTDAQVILANTYMKALINGDQNISDINTDKQPGILTFQKICSNLGQDVIYTPVKTRIEKALADKAIDKSGIIVTSIEFFKNGVVDFVALQKILTQIGENIEYGINAAGKLVKGKATRDEKTQKMSGFYVKNGILYTSAKDGKTIYDVGYDTKTKYWTINPTYKLDLETPKTANNTAVAESTSTRGYAQNLNIK